jgi:phosphate transport system protein
MERHVDEELASLKQQLIRLCALAETMIAEAVRMLVDRDAAAAAPLMAHEAEADRMQVEIDETCLRLIALFQPAAGDLRFILGAAKANTDLERMGDLAVNISHKAERLLTEPPLKPFTVISEMAAVAIGMVKESLHGYVNRQADRARGVLQRDRQLNDMKAAVAAELADIMMRDPAAVPRALDILGVSRNLERVGDHAKNMAEHTIFVVEGKDVRHQGEGA